jgi:membrane protein
MDRNDIVQLFKLSFRDWLTDNAPLRAAALTFFIILPLPTLLLIMEAIFAQFFGHTQATQIVTGQIAAIAGPAVAGLFSQLLTSASSPFSSILSSLTVVGFSLVGAIGTFAVLKDAMDVIWEVKLQKKLRLATRVRAGIGPFILVSFLGLIVMAWTAIATTLFSVIRLYLMNGTVTLITTTVVQVLLSLALSTVLFAIIYRDSSGENSLGRC